MKHNPYIGPRPYSRKDRGNFYGRNREARDLLAKIVAERVLVFYAQSGAGKSSLLNAKVIPELEETEGFHVLPMVRVGSELPSGIHHTEVDNIYVFSTLMALTNGRVAPKRLRRHTLLSFMQEFYRAPQDDLPAGSFEDSSVRPPLLIFDQFEEIFTTHRNRWQDAKCFFQQVQEALDALPSLGVVFSMREDYVAELDPYTSLFSRRLRARFRMERLGPEGALDAVVKPALNVGCRYDPGVAEQMVDDMRRIKVQRCDELGELHEQYVAGPYVEPVQLQVVCHQLWDNLPEQNDYAIQWEEIDQYGNIDRALTDFYESAVTAAVRESAVPERKIRWWFAEQLITPMETRGLVLRGQDATAELPNAAVDVLEQRRIIRADVRAGARWYEICHDRLVEPILESNRAWATARETPLRTAARHWKETGDASLLYLNASLNNACAWSQANPDDVEPYEIEFLQASRQAERARRVRRRLYVAGGILGIIILAIMASLTAYAIGAQRESEKHRRVAVAHELAAQSQVLLSRNAGLIRPMLLALESLHRMPTVEGSMVLRPGVDLTPYLLAQMAHEDKVVTVAFSPDGQRVVSGSTDNTARVWDATTGEAVAWMIHEDAEWSVVFGPPGQRVAFSPDGQWVVSGSADGTARVWDAATGIEISRMTHEGEVWTVAFSPDRQRVVSGSTDGIARVWDAATGNQIAQMIHEAPVTAVAFSPDGQRVASGSRDKTIRVWDAATGNEAARMIHQDEVWAIAFSLDGQHIVSASQDDTARVWDAATGNQVAQMVHEAPVMAVAISPDGQWVASGSEDSIVRVWDARTGDELSQMTLGSVVTAVAFSPDGQRIISGSRDNTARVWETMTGKELARMTHDNWVQSVAFSPDGQRAVSASKDNVVQVWEVKTLRAVTQMAHEEWVCDLEFSPDGQWIVSGSDDHTARVWDVTTGQEVARMTHGDWVWSVALSPDMQHVVSSSRDGTVRVWKAATGEEIARMTHTDQVWATAFSPDGQWIVSGSHDGTARVWEAMTGKEIARMTHTDQVRSVAFSPDGQWVVSGSQDGTARVWEAATGQEVARMTHEAPVDTVAFSPDGQWVASGGWDGTARVWEAATGNLVSQMRHEAGETVVAFSSDGQWVVSGSWNGTVCVWEAATGKEITRMAHEDWVWRVAFSPDKQLVVSGSHDGTARVWDATTGEEITRITYGPIATVVAFSPDGQWVASGWPHGLIRLSLWRSEDLVDEACARLHRNLTYEEWAYYLPDDAYHVTCPDLPAPDK